MGSFASIAGAKTTLTGEISRHVFEIAALSRVSPILYNYRVLVVETEGTKLPTPHAVTRTSLWHRSQERKFSMQRRERKIGRLRLLETDPETLSSVSRIPGVNCGRPSAVVLELARYRV